MGIKIKVDYSVVSRGTEKYNNVGYISISEKVGNYKYIINIDHGIKNAILSNEHIKILSSYTIENIAFSRFQLITALMYNKHKKEIKDKVLILGLGNIGISCLFFLLDNNYKIITIYLRNIPDYIKKTFAIIKENYNVEIKIITLLDETSYYNTIIDTTGSSSILNIIFENIGFNKSVVILSTPRDESYLISPLIINRKNLTIIGGHELNGVDKDYRNKTLNKLLKLNKNKNFINTFIKIYSYSENKLYEIKDKKENYIEIFKY